MEEEWVEELSMVKAEKVTSLEPNEEKSPMYDSTVRLSGDLSEHVLEKIVGRGRKLFVQRRCRVCTAGKKRSETRYMCRLCCVPLHRGGYVFRVASTNRGRLKIIYRNYEYLSHNTGVKRDTQKYWRCRQAHKKCSARCHLTPTGGITLKGQHNHPPNFDY